MKFALRFLHGNGKIFKITAVSNLNVFSQGRNQDFSRGTHNFPNLPQHLVSLTSFPRSLVAFAFLNSMLRLYIRWMEWQLGRKAFCRFFVKP